MPSVFFMMPDAEHDLLLGCRDSSRHAPPSFPSGILFLGRIPVSRDFVEPIVPGNRREFLGCLSRSKSDLHLIPRQLNPSAVCGMIPPNGEDKVCIQGDAPLRGILATRSRAVPANLTPEYFNAEKAYKAAQTEDEKLACLQHMLAVIPKHKGTEKLQADLKRRIAMLKDRLERHAKKKGVSHRVKPEGAGQIVLIGPPNSGKSSLLAALTHAEPEIGDYPFTTLTPLPGMAAYKDIQILLVDLPPISREHCESFVFDNIRGANGALLGDRSRFPRSRGRLPDDGGNPAREKDPPDPAGRGNSGRERRRRGGPRALLFSKSDLIPKAS